MKRNEDYSPPEVRVREYRLCDDLMAGSIVSTEDYVINDENIFD